MSSYRTSTSWDFVDVDAVVSDMSKAMFPSHVGPLVLAVAVLSALASLLLSVWAAAAVVAVGSAAAAALAVALAVANRRRWHRIETFDAASAAVATVWLSRVRVCHPPAKDLVNMFYTLVGGAFGDAGSRGDRVRIFAQSVSKEGFIPGDRLAVSLRRSRRPPSPPLVFSGRRHRSRGVQHRGGRCAVSLAELDVVAAVASSPSLWSLWRHASGCTQIPFLQQSAHAQTVVGACAGVRPAAIDIAVGIVEASPDVFTVFEALELAELVLEDVSGSPTAIESADPQP